MGVSHKSRIFCLLYNIDKNGLKWKNSGSNAVKVAFRKKKFLATVNKPKKDAGSFQLYRKLV